MMGATREQHIAFGECPDSVMGAHDPDRAGKCHWCRRRVSRPVPAPDRTPRTDADLSYGYFWDPDFGTDGRAVYE